MQLCTSESGRGKVKMCSGRRDAEERSRAEVTEFLLLIQGFFFREVSFASSIWCKRSSCEECDLMGVSLCQLCHSGGPRRKMLLHLPSIISFLNHSIIIHIFLSHGDSLMHLSSILLLNVCLFFLCESFPSWQMVIASGPPMTLPLVQVTFPCYPEHL